MGGLGSAPACVAPVPAYELIVGTNPKAWRTQNESPHMSGMGWMLPTIMPLAGEEKESLHPDLAAHCDSWNRRSFPAW